MPSNGHLQLKGVKAMSARGKHKMKMVLLRDLALATDPDLPEFFLGRLSALAARQAAVSPAERRALCVAAFSAFLDCLDLGLGEEARAIVGQLHDEAGQKARLAA
jgi:hypothetical protein